MKRVWARIGMSMYVSDEEATEISEELEKVSGELDIKEEFGRRFVQEGFVDGECYIPDCIFEVEKKCYELSFSKNEIYQVRYILACDILQAQEYFKSIEPLAVVVGAREHDGMMKPGMPVDEVPDDWILNFQKKNSLSEEKPQGFNKPKAEHKKNNNIFALQSFYRKEAEFRLNELSEETGRKYSHEDVERLAKILYERSEEWIDSNLLEEISREYSDQTQEKREPNQKETQQIRHRRGR